VIARLTYLSLNFGSPAVFYSFSFAQKKNWTTLQPPGPEIAEYLAGVCAKYGIVDKIQLNTEVTQLRWLEEEEEWEVTLAHLVPGTGDWSAKERQDKVAAEGEHSVYVATEIVRAKIAVSAVGGLVEPKVWPKEIPGIESFEGDFIHTARWKTDVNLKGKDVIVIGTGCSAAQVVPELIKPPYNVKSVTQLMRSPPWVQPWFPPDQIELWDRYVPTLMQRIPGLMRLVRFYVFCTTEHQWFQMFANNSYTHKNRPAVESHFLSYMRKIVPPQYHDLMTPKYQIGCKRRIIGGYSWLQSLNNPNVELTSRPLRSVQPRSVTLGATPNEAEEIQVPADAIILANGYETNAWFHPLRVLGKDGKSIHDVWEERGGPQAYLGIAMDKFPNFFMVFGPNTATGHSSVVLASENAVNYSLKFIDLILKGEISTWEVKEEAERNWTDKVQTTLKRTTFHQGGCTSWYKNDRDWNSSVYP
jgi:cation diffusion facilitator CzcD-associated flavoprotein CzcO